MANSNTLTKAASLVVAATALTAGGMVAPASASEIQDAYRAHTKQCLRLFFSDKPAHDIQCLPNNMPSPAALGGSSGNPPIVAAPVVAPPAPPVTPPITYTGLGS